MWIHIDAPQFIQINIDPHQRDVILCAVVSYRLQVLHHLRFWICQILSNIFTIGCLYISEISLLSKASSYLLVSLRAEEEDGDVVELANETSKNDVGNLSLETGFLITETMKHHWKVCRGYLVIVVNYSLAKY